MEEKILEGGVQRTVAVEGQECKKEEQIVRPILLYHYQLFTFLCVKS